ncbi:MAG: DUF58 domain-containing protein [Eubacteriales bacterium]|nr:DUF58 domain-containing protein [Eubacteriales bacterium]
MKRRKIIYAIGLLGVFILNVFYVNYQFYVLLLMVILIPFLSLCMFLLSRLGLALYFCVPDTKSVQGKKLQLLVKLQNNFPVPLADSSVYFIISCSNDEKKENKRVNINTFFDVYTQKVTMNTAHSGIITVQADKAVMQDYLHIFSNVRQFKGSLWIPVFPKLLPASERDNYEHMEGIDFNNDQWQMLSGDSDEVIDFCEYKDGDSMNKVHWKLSVKNEELIVKKFGDIDDICIRILVDLTYQDTEGFRYQLDKIYQMAYSVGHYYVRNDVKASFIIWDFKADKLVEHMFSTDAELERAMIYLMSQKCSINVLWKMAAAFEESGIRMPDKPYLITTGEYDSRDYQIINVSEDNLEQIIEALYQY